MFAPRGPKPAGVGKWAAFGFETSTSSFGGYSGKGKWPVTCEVLETDRGEERFIQVAKTDTWVFKAIAGVKGDKGSLRRVKITEHLMKKVNNKANEDVTGDDDDAEAAVAAASGNPPSTDRFDSLDTLDANPPVATPPKRRKKRKLSDLMNRVVTLEQPVVCPLATDCAASEEKIQVRFLRKHPQQLWVAENSAPWHGYRVRPRRCGRGS